MKPTRKTFLKRTVLGLLAAPFAAIGAAKAIKAAPKAEALTLYVDDTALPTYQMFNVPPGNWYYRHPASEAPHLHWEVPNGEVLVECPRDRAREIQT